MREFNIIQHGAGKNFIGALQDVIKGVNNVMTFPNGNQIRKHITINEVEERINLDNLFDNIYYPFNFNNNWHDRTNWNKELLECQQIWRKYLEKTYQKQRAKKDIIDRLNVCYKGTFHLDKSLPSIPHYSIVCILDSVEQRSELDLLGCIKKRCDYDKEERGKESALMHSWELENMNSYKADFAYDYTSLFHELDPKLITEIVERTEDAFKVESSVTIADITTLIAKYHRRNREILKNG